MSSIGDTLRRERFRRNLDLDQISRELKISSRFLEAIEDDRFDLLPAGVFAKSFVRQYARLLELDDQELATEFQHAVEPVAPTRHSTLPDVAPIPEIHVPRVDQWQAIGDRGRSDWSSALPALALVVVVMLVCSGVYAFWQRARQPIAAAQTAPPASSTPTAPVQPEPTAATQAPTPTDAPGAQITPAVSARPAPPSNSADRPANGPVHLQVTAEEPVWMLARADGKFLFSGTLEPNQSREVDANEMLTLRLGNAGGVAITLNGKSVGPVGPKGQVREVQFTSGGFQIVAAPKPSLPEDNPI